MTHVTARHECHAPGCKRPVEPRYFACKEHWYALSEELRNAIWREYRPRQERDKRPSLRYLAVQQLACAHLTFRPNDEGAARRALPYLVKAIGFRKLAVAEGLGDPLAGLLRDVERLRGEKKNGTSSGVDLSAVARRLRR